MDTSETYIKMCDCEEIQKLTPGDNSLCLFADSRGKLYWRVINTESLIGDNLELRFLPASLNEPSDFSIQNPIWLPRQDQLEEMIVETLFHLESDFAYFCSILPKIGYFIQTEYEKAFGYKPRRPELTSMEQLWLAFVMKEKYNKVWDGENWVKEN